MKLKNVFLVLLILSSAFLTAQELKTEYKAFVNKFMTNVKNDNKEAIGDLIVYPLEREYPIPDIVDKTDFIKRYKELFDSTLKNEIITSNPEKDWSDMGLRGIMLNHGSIWMDVDGRLTAVNYQSKFETDLRNKLIASQKKDLDSSIAFFQKPICILETAKFRIRIDNLGNNNYRYASWSIDKKMTEKPDLIIYRGELVVEGIGGNHQYEFIKDNFKYECAFIVLGEKNSPPAKLTIYQGTKVILTQSAKIIAK
ncbi:hypothetical protein [Flavobacterium pectinovorum]|uniref:Uncharacterized protein n=1 Tax=Flavobacterium pectinovorum TaxID=29533 RepID=A0A502F3C9_9FLAO|nr:hypothetical protein [Flavobacterium pectinovorum]TPG44705.1 hypothetical protein EAH81_04340 [Flavobacterium pectinovorum]